MSVESRLMRIEQDQRAMIDAISGLTDLVAQTRDLVTELAGWLQSAPPSELPDLLKAISANVKDQSDRITGMQRQLRTLPTDVARAVTTGEVK